MIDVEAVRRATPGVAHCLHFNNAGAALMPKCVIDEVQDYFALETKYGGHGAAERKGQEIEAVYDTIARLVGASADEIALMGSATRAWQLAFYGIDFGEGDRILTSRAEYGANYVAFLQMQKRTGCKIAVIPDDASGVTDPSALEEMIDERSKLIAITWIPTNGGLINPAIEIGRVARAHNIPYLLDACQAAGQLPIDVNEIGCDFLTAAGRKWLRGPRATGFLYVRRHMLDRFEPAVIDHDGARWASASSYELKPNARRYEVFERAPALQLGLGMAASYTLQLGLEPIRERVDNLAQTLRGELAGLSGISVQDLGVEKAGLVTFSHERIGASDIKSALGQKNINVSVSTPDNTLLDSTARALPDLVRASPHYYNSDDEIAAFLDAVREICVG